MTVRRSVMLMSAFAVVSDAVLVAFYPQFFERRYGVTSTLKVGAYIAAISLAVMCTLPLWARVARRVGTLRLVNHTQCAAGTLCVLSYWAGDAATYCLLTLPMFMFKSSYLLMFPFLMRLDPPHTHAETVGWLSVVVHVGGIFGTVAGGLVMDRFGPAACLWLMALGDFSQMAVCRRLRRSQSPGSADGDAVAAPGPQGQAGWRGVAARVLRLCIVMLVFDFSAHLPGPFFSVLWEQVSVAKNQAAAGLAYAIPGILALVAMGVNRRSSARLRRQLDRLQPNLVLGALGLALQAVAQPSVMLIGRCLFGWSVFQSIVKLEVSVFRLGQPSSYASDYSLANFFQNLGVLLSSCAAGALVGRWGAAITFMLGAVGLLLTAWLDRTLVRVDALGPPSAPAPDDDKPDAANHVA